MVNRLTPFLSLPSLCFKWKGEWERMNPSAQNDSSVRFLRLIVLLTVCESSVPPPATAATISRFPCHLCQHQNVKQESWRIQWFDEN